MISGTFNMMFRSYMSEREFDISLDKRHTRCRGVKNSLCSSQQNKPLRSFQMLFDEECDEDLV